MKKFLFLALILTLFSCNKEDDSSEQTNSSIIITVLRDNSPVGAGVQVFTNPATEQLTTDAFGQVEFQDIKIGKYDVISFIEGYGSGKTIVNLTSETERVNVVLIDGNFIEPIINIISPEENAGFSDQEFIEFKARVMDSHSPLIKLTLKWNSNLDGDLGSGTIVGDSLVVLNTDRLSENDHVITLSATNDLGISNSASVSISTKYPHITQLNITENPNNSNTLSWVHADTDISTYELYRYSNIDSQPNLIATFNAQTTNYNDSDIPFGDSVYYYLRAINTSDYSRDSNIVSSAGIPVFYMQTSYVEIDPTQPILYLKVNDNKIVGLNYETSNVQVQSTFPGIIGYFHVADNGFGKELYVPSSDGWVYIYNTDNFTLKESINVGVPVTCIISDHSGLLFMSTRPSPWWEEPLKVYNRGSLQYIDGNGDFDGCRLALLPSNNEIIEITTTVGPIDMDYYKLNASGNIILHKDDKYHGDHPLDPDIYKIAPANNFLVTAKEGAVYTADQNMDYIGMLPRGTAEFTDFEFNANASLVYAGLNGEKKIHVFNSSTLLKIDEKNTKGYPYKIFRKGNELIILSSPSPFGYYNTPSYIGVERIQL